MVRLCDLSQAGVIEDTLGITAKNSAPGFADKGIRRARAPTKELDKIQQPNTDAGQGYMTTW